MPSALPEQQGDTESRQPAVTEVNLPELPEGGQSRSQKCTGRPELPADALKRVVDAEKAAAEQLPDSLKPYSPSTPGFVFQPVEINAGGWTVIDHLTIFAGAIFDAQAQEYFKHYLELVIGAELLTNEIGPEVVRRTKLQWTRWETDVDWALRTRWTPEYYRAYVDEGNQPGSIDQKLVERFLKQLDKAVSDRAKFWREHVKAKSQESSLADTQEPAKPLSDNPRPPVSRAPAPPTTLGGWSAPPRPTVRAPQMTYSFPADFPQPSQDRVMAEWLHAESVLDEQRSAIRCRDDAEGALVRFIMRPFAAYAEEAHKLGIQGLWTVRYIDSVCLEFLKSAALDVSAAGDVNLTKIGEIRSDLRTHIECSDEWKSFRRLLRELAGAQAGTVTNSASQPAAGANLESNGPPQALPSDHQRKVAAVDHNFGCQGKSLFTQFYTALVLLR